jgi:hypothetical protein
MVTPAVTAAPVRIEAGAAAEVMAANGVMQHTGNRRTSYASSA